MPNVVLAVHLLIERNSPASLWEPYINTLPHSYNTVLYFSRQQVGSRGRSSRKGRRAGAVKVEVT